MVDTYIYQYLFYLRPKSTGKKLDPRFFFILFGINLLFLLVLDILENLIGMPIFQHAIHDDAANIFEDLGLFLIFAGLFMPVIEELVFRYHLVGYDNRKTITSFLLALPLVAVVFNNWAVGDFINLTYVLYLMIISIFLYVKKSTVSQSMILFSIVFFGLSHLSNFQFDEIRAHFLFIPVLILPQIVLGIFLSFLRIKFGLIYAIAYHALYNTVLIFVAYLLYRLTGEVF